MDTAQVWQLVAAARHEAADPDDAEDVARQATALLATRSAEVIAAADRTLWSLMARSYTNPLWAAAYVVNGGCSDDGFDYFRGWLILQGREVFERAMADPDALADVPVVRAAAGSMDTFDGEAALAIASHAYTAATGRPLPNDAFTIDYPDLDRAWAFDFGDQAEMARRLPRLTALFAA